jgi:dimethylhistidine N-methyltransferase
MRPSGALPTDKNKSGITPSADLRLQADQVGLQPDIADFAADVAHYLALEPRQLPSRYLYDALGSALFEAICELPWYTITRAELALLESFGEKIFRRTSPLSRIVELGPGNGSKLLALMRTGAGVRELHLIDVSANALDRSVYALDVFDQLSIVRHQATYEAGLREVARGHRPDGSTLVLFLGSNIGNFDPSGADAFLRKIASALQPGDFLLIGADLVKPEAELLSAYDDPLGVTAAFNRNLLVRLNRELGADFDLAAFDHRAVWNGMQSRVEMHLVTRRRQHVRIPRAEIEILLEPGETIWTESSYKYDPMELSALLGRGGFTIVERWTARQERFSLVLAQAVQA